MLVVLCDKNSGSTELHDIYIYCLEESNPLLGQDAVWGPNLEEFRKGVFNYCAVSRFVLKLNGTA